MTLVQVDERVYDRAMGTGAHAVRHAGGLYRRVFGWVRQPIQTVEHEAEHLHEIELDGSAGATPYIAILGVFLFVVPLAAFLMIVAFSAYYLAR
jgi:hypothetical protein